MGQVDDAIKDHIKLCQDSLRQIFVPWSWLTGLLVTSFLSCIVVIWGVSASIIKDTVELTSKTETLQESMRDHEERMRALENTLQSSKKIQEDVNWIRKKLETK